MFKVDQLLPVSEGAVVERLIQEAAHLPWSGMPRQMFIEGSNVWVPVFLDVSHPLQAIADERKPKARTGFGEGHIFPKLVVSSYESDLRLTGVYS